MIRGTSQSPESPRILYNPSSENDADVESNEWRSVTGTPESGSASEASADPVRVGLQSRIENLSSH